MANTALKTLLKTDLVEMIKRDISTNNNYYLFVSRISSFTDNPSTALTESDTNPPSIGETTKHVNDTIRNSLFIKRIRPQNIRLVVRRIDWTYNNTYTPYLDETDMEGTDYYVLTSDYNVYKCLGASGKSTVMPTGRSPNTIRTSDGYSWKYIYTVPEDYLGFLTLEYMPVFMATEDNPEQKITQQTSVSGAIDSISYSSGTTFAFDKVFRTDRFFVNVNQYLYPELGITANKAGSTYISFNPAGEQDNPADGYWNDYAIHVTSGPGVGQYLRILDFKKGGAGVSYYYANVYPALDRDIQPNEVGVENPSKFKIVPYVVVDGDGENGVVIPYTTGQKTIEMMSLVNSGKNYTYAKPRIVSESTSATLAERISTFNDSFKAYLSIPIGHGSNAIKEFKPANVMFVLNIEDDENQKFSIKNDYRQFGIIKSPYLYGGITLAGIEEEVSLQLLIKKDPTNSGLYSINTFVPDNYIVGRETRASAKIISSQRVPGSEYRKLLLTDVVGNFKFSNDSSLITRVYFGTGFTANTGDSVIQYQNISGLTVMAQGTVLSFDNLNQNMLIDTSYGAFVLGSTMSFLGSSGGYTLGNSAIIDVDEEFGEQIGQFSIGGLTVGSEFLRFNGYESFGRIVSTELVPTASEDVGEYRLTTRIRITSPSTLTNGSFGGQPAIDGSIHQVNSSSLKKTSADIVEYSASGLTGTLELTNVRGKFNNTDSLYFSISGSTAETLLSGISINTIYEPEIEIGSGELLYIENVRPIQRNMEQSEEFKIVIGF